MEGGDVFHDLFEVEEGEVHICQGLGEYNGMCIDRMYELYQRIKNTYRKKQTNLLKLYSHTKCLEQQMVWLCCFFV